MRELSKRVVGVKQTRRAIQEGRAARVYLAADADPLITDPLAALCQEKGVPVEGGKTLRELGRAVGIAVGAAAVAEVRNVLGFFRNSLRLFREK